MFCKFLCSFLLVSFIFDPEIKALFTVLLHIKIAVENTCSKISGTIRKLIL